MYRKSLLGNKSQG